MSTDLTITQGQARPAVVASVQLEEPCTLCDATGYLLDREHRGNNLFAPVIKDCSHCKGHGVIPSPDGRDLLRFISRHKDTA